MAELRSDLALVAGLIPNESRVLDLGCGDGELLEYLIDRQQCTGTGVDTDEELVTAAIRRGVSVIELDLDSQLDQFEDKAYDVVVLSRTLQAVRRPAEVLQQMGRIGASCIVSVPNFGLWRNRLSLIGGHMPVSRDLPWQWYDSPNVRYTTLIDLEEFFDAQGFVVQRRIPLAESGKPLRSWCRFPNLFAGAAIYQLTR